jgi:translation initiation factor 4G
VCHVKQKALNKFIEVRIHLDEHLFGKFQSFRSNEPFLDEAHQCIVELQCPDYYPEVVKEAVNLALYKGTNFVDPIVRLLEHLYTKKNFKTQNLESGCLLYGTLLDGIGIDLPKALAQFGEIIGRLTLLGALRFEALEVIVKKM